MAEAETVCTTIGILSQGQLKCIGTPQHLKSRFGQGYKLELQCEEGATQDVHKLVNSISPESRLLHGAASTMVFQIPKTLLLSEVFDIMERQSRKAGTSFLFIVITLKGIKSWSMGQSNLEEVFVAIVHQDEEASELHAPEALPVQP